MSRSLLEITSNRGGGWKMQWGGRVALLISKLSFFQIDTVVAAWD